MKICFLVLAHNQPHHLARLIKRLLQEGDMVALHLDLKAPADSKDILRTKLGPQYEKILWADPVSIAWGEWSMVEATLNGLRAIDQSPDKPDYVYLLSGADYPIRPLTQLRKFLSRNNGREFIESIDADRYHWVKDGIQRERYLYRHWVSWKTHPRLHSLLQNAQRILRMERKFPEGFSPHLGSQWWTLTWSTCQAVLEIVKNRQPVNFFTTTWIPDELFFQTVVRNIVSHERNIDNRHLTLYQFSGYGVPLVYYDGHEDYLIGQPFFFARKFSPHALGLRDAIDGVLDHPEKSPRVADASVGHLLPDYDRFLLTHGTGLKGRRSMGRIRDAWYGDLVWNTLPYFVVVSDSREALTTAQSVLNERPDTLCHGELFRENAINFANNKQRFAGYGRDDIKLRDHSPQNFFVDLIQDTPDQLTGYLLCTTGADRDVSRKIAKVNSWDQNATIIFLRTDPVDLFSLDKNKSAKIGKNHEFIAEALVGYYKSYSESLLGAFENAACQSEADFYMINCQPGNGEDYRAELQKSLNQIVAPFADARKRAKRRLSSLNWFCSPEQKSRLIRVISEIERHAHQSPIHLGKKNKRV